MEYAISSMCLVIALMVAACSKEAGVEIDPRAGKDEAGACRAQGGDWRRVSMAQVYQCVKPFADAGMVCGDSTECQGECLVELVTTCDEKVSAQIRKLPMLARRSRPIGCSSRLEIPLRRRLHWSRRVAGIALTEVDRLIPQRTVDY